MTARLWEKSDEDVTLQEIFDELGEDRIREEVNYRQFVEVAPQRKVVYRNGKKQKKWVCPKDKAGNTYKKVTVAGKDKPRCVKITGAEKVKLSKAAKKGAKKRKATSNQAKIKRARTNKKKKAAGN